MRALIIIISTLFVNISFAQDQYQKAMGEALTLWETGKTTEAISKMERIASVEKENWIPRYYQALIATVSSFHIQDLDQKKALIQMANDIIPKETTNAEWYILKATVLMSELTMDPMNNAMSLSPLIIANYEKAISLEPNNPRAISGLASFQIRSKTYTGGNTEQDYKDLQKAVSLYDTQKSDIPFYPSWGKEQAEQALMNYDKK